MAANYLGNGLALVTCGLETGVDLPALSAVLTTDTLAGEAGTFDLAAAEAAAAAGQLVTDTAAVTAEKGGVLTTTTILGVTGTFNRLTWEAGRNTDPGVAHVEDGVTYKITGADLEGTLEVEPPETAPATPTITGVNDLTGTSATITVDGASGVTNRLKYRRRWATAWTTGLTCSGDGTIQQTGLTAGLYEFVAYSEVGGVYSLWSGPADVYVSTEPAGPDEALYELLSDFASGRVAHVLAQRTWTSADYIVYQRLATPRGHTADGGDTMPAVHYQVTCWSRTTLGAARLADQIRLALDGYQGDVAVGGDTVTVDLIAVEDEGDMPVDTAGPETARLAGRYLDLAVHVHETVL